MSESSQPWKHAVIAIISIITLFAAILWVSPVRHSRGIPNCKGNLKMFGLSIHQYYSDGKGSNFPTFHGDRVNIDNPQEFQFNRAMISCRADHSNGDTHYLWNLKASGAPWAQWNNSHSPLIWDASPHKYKGKVHVLFGDGSVEEMTPERLKELTK